MHPATWIFYAIASLSLGLIAIASGAAFIVEDFFLDFFKGRESSGSGEPLQTVMVAVTLGVSVLFLAGGLAALRTPRQLGRHVDGAPPE